MSGVSVFNTMPGRRKKELLWGRFKGLATQKLTHEDGFAYFRSVSYCTLPRCSAISLAAKVKLTATKTHFAEVPDLADTCHQVVHGFSCEACDLE